LKTRLGKSFVVTPGRVGQPKDGNPRAGYAVSQDGRITVRHGPYDGEETVRAFADTPLDPSNAEMLAEVLRTGGSLPT
jgi:diadenosine tetraphosphatase ApaH/serine/threonine PP2A family protein phosphatase